jgi:hypothetical protein
MNKHPFSSMLTIAAALSALTACGGGSSAPVAPVEPPPLIQVSNSLDVAALSKISTDRIFKEHKEIADFTIALLLKSEASGDVTCALGGKLVLNTNASDRRFTAVNCQTTNLLLVSGEVNVNYPVAGAPQKPAFTYKNLSYRSSSDVGVQTVNGNMNHSIAGDNFGFTGDLTYLRSSKLDTYSKIVGRWPDSNGQLASLGFDFSSPRLSFQLAVSYGPGSSLDWAATAKDNTKTRMGIRPNSTYELQTLVGFSLVDTKTITASDLANAIKRMLD